MRLGCQATCRWRRAPPEIEFFSQQRLMEIDSCNRTTHSRWNQILSSVGLSAIVHLARPPYRTTRLHNDSEHTTWPHHNRTVTTLMQAPALDPSYTRNIGNHTRPMRCIWNEHHGTLKANIAARRRYMNHYLDRKQRHVMVDCLTSSPWRRRVIQNILSTFSGQMLTRTTFSEVHKLVQDHKSWLAPVECKGK